MNGRNSTLLSSLLVPALFLMMWGSVTGDDADTVESDLPQESSEDKTGVQFADDFSYASGAQFIQKDRDDPVVEGEMHADLFTFMRLPSRFPGHIKLIMTEDNTVDGPDDQPGVLRMEIAEVPRANLISGFVFQGNKASGDISMPGWERGKLSINDLRRAFVTFRFRAENREDPNSPGATFRLSFQPDVTRGPNSAAEFGDLIATSRWRTFRRPLASAENLGAFLEVVNGENPERFRLLWTQADLISKYRPGDSLLIDDLKISIE